MLAWYMKSMKVHEYHGSPIMGLVYIAEGFGIISCVWFWYNNDIVESNCETLVAMLKKVQCESKFCTRKISEFSHTHLLSRFSYDRICCGTILYSSDVVAQNPDFCCSPKGWVKRRGGRSRMSTELKLIGFKYSSQWEISTGTENKTETSYKR